VTAATEALNRHGDPWTPVATVTQYGSTDQQLQWGAQINQTLAADGARDKHFVINTDENGSPYMAGQIPGGGAGRTTRPVAVTRASNSASGSAFRRPLMSRTGAGV
jgi:hypothetical protein